jgi:hypothetical protein
MRTKRVSSLVTPRGRIAAWQRLAVVFENLSVFSPALPRDRCSVAMLQKAPARIWLRLPQQETAVTLVPKRLGARGEDREHRREN